MEKDQYSNPSVSGQDIHRQRREHLLQYLLLIVIFIFSIFLLIQLSSSAIKLVVIAVLSAFYLIWGIWHHREEKNLIRVHFFEYLIISVLIFTVLFFVFVRF